MFEQNTTLLDEELLADKLYDLDLEQLKYVQDVLTQLILKHENNEV